MNLHTPITRGRKTDYCGPTAIAAVTGLPLKRIREAIIQQRDYKRTADNRYWPIAGMNELDLVGTMDLLGWSVVEHKQIKSARYTLAEFCEDRGGGGPFIIVGSSRKHWSGKHYVAISNHEFCDTFTMTPIPLKIAVRPGKRDSVQVKEWWRFANVDWDADTKAYVTMRNTLGPVLLKGELPKLLGRIFG